MDTHGSDNGAESDAGAGGCGGCFHAWRTGPELYVSGFACHTDTVHPEHVSISGDSGPCNTRSAVLGQAGYKGAR